VNDAEAGRARRRRSLPLRLKYEGEDGESGHERVLRAPFRLGFGDDCDIRLHGGKGPDVVFQVERTRGPLLIAQALPPQECEHYVELTIDGEPLRQPLKELHPGARLEILDKAAQRRYRLVLDPGGRLRWPSRRTLAVALLLLVGLGAGFSGYLYMGLLGTRSEVEHTAQRVQRTEQELSRAVARILESTRRMGATDAELAESIEALVRLQARSASDLRQDFTRRLTELDAASRADLARVAEADAQRRMQLAEQAQTRLEALREEFSARMVLSYTQLKEVEQRLRDAMGARFESRAAQQDDLKQVLARSRDAVLLVRTRYSVRFAPSGETRELVSMGTGFLVGPEGLAASAQHVMFPWRYDRELLVLTALGLAELVPDSTHWSVWFPGARVLKEPQVEGTFDEASGYGSEGPEPRLQLLAAPEPERVKRPVPSPMGLVELELPLPGASDVAVFQIMRFGEALQHLSLPEPGSGLEVEELDPVLVLGYPYSRLDAGMAAPQGVRGFVRRVSGDMLEVDAAVHPGLSGGPILGTDGSLIGMVSAIVGSEVYGVAVRADDLATQLADTAHLVREEEARLAALGCDPGAVDGVFDALTWKAYACEAQR
jgi:S1-C subfamily serine protease